MATLYQKRTAAKRASSDITRLIDQYQKSVKSLTGDYETAFANYQSRAAQNMEPYEQRIAEFRSTALPEYERQAAAYNQSIADYQKMIDDYNANPYTRVKPETTRTNLFTGRSGSPLIRGGNVISAVIDGDVIPYHQLAGLGYEPIFQYQGVGRNRSVVGIESIKMPKDEPIPFKEPPPTMPTFPEAPPQQEEFDTTQFDVRRKQLEVELGREIGERKSARLAAVSRRSRRPLLQGV